MSIMKFCCSTNYVLFHTCWIHMKTQSSILGNFMFDIYWLQMKTWAIYLQPSVLDMYCFKRLLVLYGQWGINYIIFCGCIALDCWLLKKFSYSLSVGINIVTDHLLGIYVSWYIFVWQQTICRYIYVSRYKLYRRHLQWQKLGDKDTPTLSKDLPNLSRYKNTSKLLLWILNKEIGIWITLS